MEFSFSVNQRDMLFEGIGGKILLSSRLEVSQGATAGAAFAAHDGDVDALLLAKLLNLFVECHDALLLCCFFAAFFMSLLLLYYTFA